MAEGIGAVFAGLYLVTAGLTSKHLIAESEVKASREDVEKAVPSFMRRTVVVSVGLASLIFGCIRLFR